MMSKLLKQLKINHKHRKYVRQACWKMGLFWQGLVHDLSKYSIAELSMCKYYTGDKSPHQVCRETLGYSPAWNHHYHRNKHHFEFWWDEDERGNIIPVKMPYKYVIESVCDMMGASKSYNPKNWDPKLVWKYWEDKCAGQRLMHPESVYLTAKLLWNLSEMGEERFYAWYKNAKHWLKEQYENCILDY